MPEGDTLFRTADVLRRVLLGERITDAQARPGGARLDLVVGSRVDDVRSQGKHLLMGFDVGLTLHTHLGMKGSWHRYGPAERWRRHPDAADAVLRTARSVAVCFAAPIVELIETRALPVHPVLARLGPDLLAGEHDISAATERLLAPERAELTVAEAILDQSAVAGIGNVYRSEIVASV
jgi:endonuclease-8